MDGIFYRKVEGATYAAPKYGREITLKVGRDIEGEGIAAMSGEAMAELGISGGDTVDIIGAWTQKATAVLLEEAGDITILRMDGKTRSALPVDVGHEVGVRREYRSE